MSRTSASGLPLSAAQLGIWTGQTLEPGTTRYNTAEYVELRGAADATVLARALASALRDADALHARIRATSEGALQDIAEDREIDVPVLDLRAHEDPERAARDAMKVELDGPLDMREGPLFRAFVLRLAEQRHYLYLVAHHVALDGHGFTLVLQRTAAHYAALVASGPVPEPMPGLASVVAVDARYAGSAAEREDGRFFRMRLEGAPLPVALGRSTRLGASAPLRFVQIWSRAERERLEATGRGAGASYAEVVIAAVARFVHHQTGESDLTLGLPFLNREGVALRVPSMSMNIVPLRVRIGEARSASELIAHVKAELAVTKPHARYRYERLRRDLGRLGGSKRLFGAVVNLMPFAAPLAFKGLACSRHNLAAGPVEDVALSLRALEGGGLELTFEANAEGHDAASAGALAEALFSTLRELGERPFAALEPAKAPDGRVVVLRGEPLARAPEDVIACIQRHARERPAHPALVCGDQALSYAELDAAASGVAERLSALGAGPGELVAVLLPRGALAIQALLGTLVSGAAYLPLDPEGPRERLRAILRAASPIAIVTSAELRALQRDLQAQRWLVLDEAPPASARPPAARGALPEPSREQLAYVIYTSGTTGKPNGVMIERGALAHFVAAATQAYGLTARDRVFQFAPLHFDASVEEIFLTLCAGAMLVLRTSAAPMSVAQLMRECDRHRVQVLDLPTAMFHELSYALAHGGVPLSGSVHTLIIGGEAAQPERVADFVRAAGARVRLFNSYGPTEATVVATYARLSADAPRRGEVPIGRPLPGTQAAVVFGGPGLAEGAGELYLLGPGLARGYLGDELLTEQRFAHVPGLACGARAYRTGDRARVAAGELYFAGRGDDELKISGHRVDPLEIERVLSAAPGVREAAVVAHARSGGTPRLLAYVVLALGSGEGLRAHCRAHLVAAAVPAEFHVVAQLPRTNNGKIDRRALARRAASEGSTAQAATPLQQLVLDVWSEVLGTSVPSLDADFFELGGQSLDTIRVATRLAARLGREVPVPLLFQYPTVRDLSDSLAEDRQGAALPSQVPQAVLTDSVLPDDVLPRGRRPRAASLREVLLTGATGFVGAHLLVALLRDTDATVHCLVRAESAAQAEARLREALARFELEPERLPALSTRVKVVPGRLDAPRFGLGEREYSALSALLDGIIHCGASVSLLRSYHSLAGSNVRGTLEVLRLAGEGRAAVHHVSTLAVGLGHARQGALDEDFVPLPTGLPDGYTQSKWAAEQLMAQAHARGLPVTVYRLGRVIAPAGKGSVNAQDIVFRTVAAGIACGCLPALDVREPWTPVDFVADAIVKVVQRGCGARPVVHLVPPEQVSLREVFGWVRDYGYDVRIDTPEAFRAALGARDDAELRATLAFFSARGAEQGGALPAMAFRAEQLQARLGDAAPVCPRLDRERFARYLEHAVRKRSLPPPPSAAGERAPDPRFVPWPEPIARSYREAGVYQGLTLWEMLVERAETRAEAVAVVDGRVRRTYAELLSRATAIAGGLARLGLGPGDAVIVQLPNRAELIELYFALFRLGARPIAAQVGHRRRELSHFAKVTSAVAYVFCPQLGDFDYGALARELCASCPTLRHAIAVSDDADFLGFEALLEDPAELPELPSASEIALFQLSGGSTHVPKIIARTHDDYLYSVRRSVEVCGFDERTVYLAALPIAHNFPLSSPGVLGALYAGGRVVIAAGPAPDEAFPWIARERANVTAIVPAVLPSWLARAARDRTALGSLELLQVGGAKLHEALARRVPGEFGCRLQQVFGMAEGLVCYTAPDAPLDEVVSTQGRPMSPLDEVRVVDEHGRDVPDGTTGHLLARGPYTIRGYYAAEAHNREAFTRDGFYRTGDLVRRLPSGSLVVEGRSKEQINRGGEKIAAPELEAALCELPEIELAAVIGVPDAHLGERTCAFVVANPAVTLAQVQSQLRALGLAEHKLPDRIELRPTLPRTPVGKIDKRALLAESEAKGEPGARRIPAVRPYPLPRPAELPESRLSWTPDPDRAVLLVHDLQRYFLACYEREAEPLATMLANVSRLHAACELRGVPSVFSAQPGRADVRARGLLNDLWGPGLSARPELEGLAEELVPGPADLILHKTRYSAFFGTELEARLRELGRDQLWICGIYAHIGCLTTALDAFMRDVKPFLIADALADFGREPHERALRHAAETCGAVTHTDALCAVLGAPQEAASSAFEIACSELSQLLEQPAAALDPAEDLRVLGLDSIRRMALFEALQRSGLRVDPIDVLSCVTLAELRALCDGAGTSG